MPPVKPLIALDHVLSLEVDDFRALVLGHGKAAGDRVNGEDASGIQQLCAGNRELSYGTATEHGYGTAGMDFREVGGHAAGGKDVRKQETVVARNGELNLDRFLGHFAAAVAADSVNLEGVTGGVKAVLVSDLLFQFADFRREELHGDAALRTYHVMVAAAVELVLVTGDAVMKSHLTGQPAFGQQLECAIYGREPDLRILLADQAE